MSSSFTTSIGSPIIVSPAIFKVRYRLLPAGAWSIFTDETNAPFTISGLADGSYELEVIYVTPLDVECSPTYTFFEIITPYTCRDFTGSIVTSPTSLPYINLSYSTPSPITNPPCGYIISWQNLKTGAKGSTNYASLPLGGVMKIYMTGTVSASDDVRIIVYADLCNGKLQECYNHVATAPAPPCTPMVLTTAELIYTPPPSPTPNTFHIRLTIANSNPTTPLYIVNYQETSPTGPNVPDKGVFNYTGAASATPSVTLLFSFQIFPKSIFNPPFNPDLPNYNACIQYKGSIIDACGVSHPFCVTHPDGCLSCSS